MPKRQRTRKYTPHSSNSNQILFHAFSTLLTKNRASSHTSPFHTTRFTIHTPHFSTHKQHALHTPAIHTLQHRHSNILRQTHSLATTAKLNLLPDPYLFLQRHVSDVLPSRRERAVFKYFNLGVKSPHGDEASSPSRSVSLLLLSSTLGFSRAVL